MLHLIGYLFLIEIAIVTDKIQSYIARPPRHQADIGKTDLDIEVRREKGLVPDVMQADLVNLSRRGFGIHVPVPLLLEEMLTLHFRHTKANLDLEIMATVCRIMVEESGMWFVGCRAIKPLPPEVLGELFLNQILSTTR